MSEGSKKNLGKNELSTKKTTLGEVKTPPK